MSNQLHTFEFQGNSVRTIVLDGKPWFVASDVARTLGYSNPRKAIIDHCKGSHESLLPSDGGSQATKIIPESDVYRLVMRSKLPEAERFQDWVVEEVLPSIRRTGGYITPLRTREEVYQVAGLDVAVPRNFSEALRTMAELSDVAEEQHAKIQVLVPKAAFHDAVTNSDDAQALGAVARVLGTGQNRLFAWMREQRILLPNNLPFQEFLDRGYFRVIKQVWDGNSGQHVTPKTLVTAKGLPWLQKKWEARNIPPKPRPTMNAVEFAEFAGVKPTLAKTLLEIGWARGEDGLLPSIEIPERRWDKKRVMDLWNGFPDVVKNDYRNV